MSSRRLMEREALVEILKRDSASRFLEEHVFDRVPHVFTGDRALFVSWKRALAQALEVDPACLTVVGGAAVGNSLNPGKNLKAFDPSSDVDVAVVSHYHFTVAWRYLRTHSDRRLRVDARTRIAWDDHVRTYIYWGTIATDKLLGVLPFGLQWLKAQASMSSIDPTKGHSVNFRIYSDFEALRSYQLMSIKNVRASLFD
ncbi:MAG: hypothetical protein ACRD8A_04075 [Candidatus Acidiferrales bacterium]